MKMKRQLRWMLLLLVTLLLAVTGCGKQAPVEDVAPVAEEEVVETPVVEEEPDEIPLQIEVAPTEEVASDVVMDEEEPNESEEVEETEELEEPDEQEKETPKPSLLDILVKKLKVLMEEE